MAFLPNLRSQDFRLPLSIFKGNLPQDISKRSANANLVFLDGEILAAQHILLST